MSLSVEQGDLLSPTKSRGERPSVRRLSSMTVNRSDLFAGPTVVSHPQHMSKPSNAHSTAMAMELAKHHLAEGSQAPTPDFTPAGTPDEDELRITDKYAFAFDIDGVLIKGGDVIPEAIEAMKMLNGQNEYQIKV